LISHENKPVVAKVQISDVDVEEMDSVYHGGLLKVRMSVAHGKLTLKSSEGLLLVEGVQTVGFFFPSLSTVESQVIGLQGSLKTLNVHLVKLWYQPRLDWAGVDSLTVGIQLRGKEDEAFSIASIRVENVDVGESFGATLWVQLCVRNGQIQLSKFSGFEAGV
jgi:hypothetical protein